MGSEPPAAGPNAIVFAGTRKPATQSLKDRSCQYPNVHHDPVKVTSGDQADNEAAVSEIKKHRGAPQLFFIINLVPNFKMAAGAGLTAAPVEDYVAGVMSRVDGATVQKSSRIVWNYEATHGTQHGRMGGLVDNFLPRQLDCCRLCTAVRQAYHIFEKRVSLPECGPC
ncbi:hypothetical protein C8R43DRAFT_1150728 [Mycena crocata]|nr:hypothetical protein C8R43DRAFT_1150728 [Mycena crocata]